MCCHHVYAILHLKVGDFMNEPFIFCDTCGAKCDVSDTYCKFCSHTLSHSNYLDEQIIVGIENSELKNYIGKNSDYYVKNFAKKKGKWFIQLNFAALLFGPTWFFYRKMNKIAIMYAAVLILLSSLLTLVLPTIFKGDVERYYLAKETYSNYINSGGEVNLYKEPPYSTVVIGTHPTFQKIRDELDDAQNKIRLIEFLVTAPVFAINVLFRLFANSIYKNHIPSNIHSNHNGVSMKNAIGGLVLVNLIMFVISLLLNQISVISQFTEATQTLFYWI